MFKNGIGGGLTNMAMDAMGLGATGVIVDAAGKSIKSLADMMVQFRRDSVMGVEQDAGAMVDKFMEGVPAIGSMWAAGRGLHEAITGARLETELLAKAGEISVQMFAAMAAKTKDLKGILTDIDTSITKHKTGIAQLNEGDPYKAALLGVNADIAAQPALAAEARNTRLGKFDKDQAAVVKAASDDLANEKQQFKNTFHGQDAEDLKREAAGGDPYKQLSPDAKRASDAIDAAQAHLTEVVQRGVEERKKIVTKSAEDEQLAVAEITQKGYEKAMADRRTAQLKDLDDQEKLKKEARDKAETNMESASRQSNEAADAEIQQRRTIAKARSETLAKRLGGSAGSMESIRGRYADQIAAAKSNEEKDALYGSMALDMMAQGQASNTFNKRMAGGTGAAERYGGGLSEALTMRTALVDASKNTRVSAERLTQIVELLEKNEDKTGAELRVIVVGALGNNN